MTDMVNFSGRDLETPMFGFRFFNQEMDEVIGRIHALSSKAYSFVITPNIDFIVRAHETPAIADLYRQARLHLCDSRVLQLIVRFFGYRLILIPGSDLVCRIFDTVDRNFRIAIVGPDGEDFGRLRVQYPDQDMALIESPRSFAANSPEWQCCLEDAAQADWDILLICFGSPKQEQFAADLAGLRARPGVALCVGASVDFMTGRQKRAPRAVRYIGLEWLFRLAMNPRRMYRRYIFGIPKFLKIVVNTSVSSRSERLERGGGREI